MTIPEENRRITHVASVIITVFMTAAFAAVWLLYYNNIAFRTHRELGALAGLTSFYNFAVHNISVFSAYSQYGEITSYAGSGIMQFVLYLPLFYLAILAYKGVNNSVFSDTVMLVTLTGFFYAMLGYRLEVVVRMANYFCSICIFLVPMLLFMQKQRAVHPQKMVMFNYRSILALWFVYIGYRGFDTMMDLLKIGTSSGMRVWHFYWPF